VLRRPATSSFLNFFDSEPACFLTSFHVIKKQVIFPSSSGSSFPTQLPSDYTHPTTLASPWCIHRKGLEEILSGRIREILARKRFCRIHKNVLKITEGHFYSMTVR
jgi:hypothetical protein